MSAERLVELLKKLSSTITTVESCTGGYIISTITDVEGASALRVPFTIATDKVT